MKQAGEDKGPKVAFELNIPGDPPARAVGASWLEQASAQVRGLGQTRTEKVTATKLTKLGYLGKKP